MKPCWFHPEAFAEADEAAAFYKEQQPKLEVRFLEALNDTISRIRRNPLIYRRIEGEVKKCRMLRFPYGVIYRVDNDRIEIIAVMHLRSGRVIGNHEPNSALSPDASFVGAG